MDPRKKADASLHNAKAAFSDNPSVGSIPPEPALLTGGGGSISGNSGNELLGLPPTTIKRRASDPCYYGQPCSDLWNTHSDIKDLRRHLHYLFGVSWRAISRILDDYGVDHINQNIHETREYVRDQVAQGKTIKTLAGSFMYCMDGIRDAEPELSPEAAAQRDVTVKASLDQLRPKKKTTAKDDRNKYLEEYNKRSKR
jgi:hypothetical protein